MDKSKQKDHDYFSAKLYCYTINMSIDTINMATVQTRIRRIAATVKWAAMAAMAGILAVAAYSLTHQSSTWKTTWMSGVTVHADASSDGAGDPQLALWLELLPEVALFYGLIRLVQMMRACERGEIFSSRVSTHLQAFSVSIIVVELLNITLPFQIAALRALLGRNVAVLVLAATGEQLWSLLLAILFLMLALILKESARLAEDNASIV
jgi:hypothetical protein